MIDVRRYLDIFLDGARQQVEDIEQGLRDGGARSDKELHALRRAWHTLKGMTATMELASLSELCHLAESVLDGAGSPTGAKAAALLQEAVEDVRAGLTALENGEATVPSPSSLPRLRDHIEGRLADASAPGAAVPEVPQAMPRRIRVATEDLDAVLADVAELQAAAVALLPAAGGPPPQADRLVRGLGRLSRRISSMRLVPFSLVVPSLEKTVAAAARETGRPARLAVRGGDTRLDRATLETLVEPMVHLLRNALAHASEAPEARRRAGKSLEMELGIDVRLERNRLRVVVHDDGPGVDLDAVARRLALAEGQRRRLDQPGRDLSDLLCRPGVSTRPRVSALAGRGVGLDAVRQCMVRAGGAMFLSSRTGKGVIVRLDLRPSLSVTPCLLAASAGTTYGFPLASVIATDAAPMPDVARAQRTLDAWSHPGPAGRVPARPLPHLLSDEAEWSPPDRIAVVKMTLPGQPPFGVIVDSVLGHLSVPVRPLPPALAGERWLGTALCGDGTPVAVLDPVWLAGRASGA